MDPSIAIPPPIPIMRRCASDPSSQRRPLAPVRAITPHMRDLPLSSRETTTSVVGTAETEWPATALPSTGSAGAARDRPLVRQRTAPICDDGVLRRHWSFDMRVIGTAAVAVDGGAGERVSPAAEFDDVMGGVEDWPVARLPGALAEAEVSDWRSALLLW